MIRRIMAIFFATILLCVSTAFAQEKNETLMQGFDWEVPEEPALWTVYSNMAKELSDAGITMLWIPPAYKCSSGTWSVGYDPYDYYDLGEFDQKGTIKTKYGAIDQLKQAVKSLHQNKVKVIADIVINHMFGADANEIPEGNWDFAGTEVATKFSYEGRNNKYSSFEWNWHCFDAMGIGERDNEVPTLFPGKDWDNTYGDDYLCGLDIDYQNPKVQQEMTTWGKWFVNTLDLDGFRIDAIKYIDADFLKAWLDNIRSETKKNLWAVGEAWIEDEDFLKGFINSINKKTNVLDFPLHRCFNDNQEQLDFRELCTRGLVNSDASMYAVTFVENHDTYRPSEQRDGIKQYKDFFYAYILTLDRGIPCVFWKDYFEMKSSLVPMLKARKDYAYGKGMLIDAGKDFYIYQRLGTDSKNGLVLLMSTGNEKKVSLKANPRTTYFDIMGNNKGRITTDKNGAGTFTTPGGKISIWVPIQTK